MREIKFRAWNVVELEMTLHDSFYELQKWNRTEEELSQFSIMQNTTLKDKNGVEIYEGDILNICYSSNSGEFIHDCIYTASISSMRGIEFNFVKLLWVSFGYISIHLQ